MSTSRDIAAVEREMTTLRLRVEELESQHGFDARRLEVVAREREVLRDTLSMLRAHTEELRATLSTERDSNRELLLRIERQRVEQRVLMQHLIRTETVMQARTEQLGKVLSSRWYRLARSSWQLRRRRPPLGAVILSAFAVAVVVVPAILATTIATVIAGLLGGAIVACGALGYAVAVPAIRDKRKPRLAGTGSFADLLPGEGAILEELRASEASLGTEAETTATPEPTPAVPAPAPPSKVVTRLVPSTASPTSERDVWLATGRIRALSQLRVAGVLDEMSRACFDPECRLQCDFTMADWRERLEADPPHLLLVESAWSGNGGGWQYGVASYPHPDYRGLPQLRALIAWCRERGIPTVFWNKEDPVHFERFKEAAALFDHIFTTDANCIPAYEQLGGEFVRSVGSLQFAAQPRMHNPIPIVGARSPEPVFAGTYYRNRHVDRRSSLEMILDAARPFGLVIYDRTFGSTSDEYGFPERFVPHIKGRLPYDQVISTYKRHRVFLNVNSVTDSPTMFSRRVFELLACGTAVLSTESAGMQTLFGDLVPVAESPQDATGKLERLLQDDAYHHDLVTRASRLVLSRHTYRERLAEVARAAGFDLEVKAGEETAALLLVDSAEDLQMIESGFLAQSRAPDEILVGLADENLVGPGLERLTESFGATRVRTVVQRDSSDRLGRWRELGAMASSQWVAPWQRPAGYGEHHLRDLVAATRFAEADVFGFPAPGTAETLTDRYAGAVDPSRALARRELVAARGWAESPEEQSRWFDQGVRLYATADEQILAAGTSPSVPASPSAQRVGRRLRARRR